jgi:hypothetical protein
MSQISRGSTAFDAQPPDLPPVDLRDMGFAIIASLARHRRPQSVACSSVRILASRFFQASPRGEYYLTLALC